MEPPGDISFSRSFIVSAEDEAAGEAPLLAVGDTGSVLASDSGDAAFFRCFLLGVSGDRFNRNVLRRDSFFAERDALETPLEATFGPTPLRFFFVVTRMGLPIRVVRPVRVVLALAGRRSRADLAPERDDTLRDDDGRKVRLEDDRIYRVNCALL